MAFAFVAHRQADKETKLYELQSNVWYDDRCGVTSVQVRIVNQEGWWYTINFDLTCGATLVEMAEFFPGLNHAIELAMDECKRDEANPRRNPTFLPQGRATDQTVIDDTQLSKIMSLRGRPGYEFPTQRVFSYG